MDYVLRSLAPRLTEYLDTFPAVMVWGPRQCGKSTFVAHELPHFEHYDLERPADFRLISEDPELFLTDHSEQVCIDEAQRFPEIFPVLRHVIDKGRRKGRFVLLGSSGLSSTSTAHKPGQRSTFLLRMGRIFGPLKSNLASRYGNTTPRDYVAAWKIWISNMVSSSAGGRKTERWGTAFLLSLLSRLPPALCILGLTTIINEDADSFSGHYPLAGHTASDAGTQKGELRQMT